MVARVPELEDDDKLLHAIDTVAEVRSIYRQIMANRQSLKKQLEEQEISSESERLQKEMDYLEQRLRLAESR